MESCHADASQKGINSMIYYTADLHLHHKNILHLCERPFADLEEMHRVIKANWNAVITDQDDVYIIGDVCFGFNQEIMNLLPSH